MRARQMDKLIALTEKYSDGDEIRITVETNLIVPHIPDAKLGACAAGQFAASALSFPLPTPAEISSDSDRQTATISFVCVGDVCVLMYRCLHRRSGEGAPRVEAEAGHHLQGNRHLHRRERASEACARGARAGGGGVQVHAPVARTRP